jgi:site-specific DNA-methyltransferase (adenine-specific)
MRINELFGGKMQFDVIIGNPPYQLASDGGTRDIPIYNKFVEQAKKLEPRYLSMVIPSRWMASGLGLSEFRKSMLEDRHLRRLIDYERMDLVFPGVDFEGGICYFLWDRDHAGNCDVTTVTGEEKTGPLPRDLSEYDIFVRDSRGLNILKKVRALDENSIVEILSADKEFGWTSNFDGFRTAKKSSDVALYYGRAGKRLVGGIARKAVTKSPQLIDTWKVMTSAAYGERGARPAMVLGTSFIAESPSVCTQTYLFFYVDSKKQAESLQSYLNTRFFRFLVSLRKITQHATRATYTWVPQQTWDRVWTDEVLYRKYSLSREDIAYIEASIRPKASGDE